MVIKQITSPILVFSLLLSIISTSFSTTPLRHQTLVLNPQQQSQSQSQSQSQPQSKPAHDYKNTLSMQLIHKDHLNPLASNLAHEVLLERRLSGDKNRVKAIFDHAAAAFVSQSDSDSGPRSINWPISSGLLLGTLQYLALVGVGTPPKPVYLALGTGIDVVWLQCLPCTSCYNQSDPIFNPKNSSTFSPISCDDSRCKQLGHADYSNCRKNNRCLYNVSYDRHSSTSFGELSSEKLTFGNTTVDNVTLGCGHDNKGGFINGYAGFLGLGRGDLSFPTQYGHRIFSYCLAFMYLNSTEPPSNSSSISFGELVVPPGTNFTSLLPNPNKQLSSFYYVGLVGISVGGIAVPGINESLFKMDENGQGGVIVDSVTSLTYLTEQAYTALVDAFRKAFDWTVISTDYGFNTCYNISGTKKVDVPTVTLHIDGGVDMDLPAYNYMLKIDDKGTFCFAFGKAEGKLSIIGNIQQQGFRVSFDLDKNRVGFAANACPM